MAMMSSLLKNDTTSVVQGIYLHSSPSRFNGSNANLNKCQKIIKEMTIDSKITIKAITSLSLSLSFLTPLSAFGAIDLTDNLSVSGFASTSLAKSNNDVPLLINRNINDELCFDCDTTAGVQLDFYHDDFKASLQVVKRPQDSWSDPQIEWAYVGYEINEFDFRAGRLRLPLFLASEYYYVGQAYTTARPTDSIYNSSLGITAYNGFSLQWTHDFEAQQLILNPFIGFDERTDIRVSDELHHDFDTDYVVGLNAQLSGDSYRWNWAYMHTQYDLVNSVNRPNVPFPIVESEENTVLKTYSVGAEYDFSPVTLTVEAQKNDYISSWYGQLRYTMGEVTPYVNFNQQYNDKEKLSGSSLLIGAQYNFFHSASLNMEVQHFTTKHGRGSFVKEPPEDNANLFTIMLSFVF